MRCCSSREQVGLGAVAAVTCDETRGTTRLERVRFTVRTLYRDKPDRKNQGSRLRASGSACSEPKGAGGAPTGRSQPAARLGFLWAVSCLRHMPSLRHSGALCRATKSDEIAP